MFSFINYLADRIKTLHNICKQHTQTGREEEKKV